MSNPSIATKLLTLVKGVFGRKQPVPAVVPAKEDENTSPASAKEGTTEESRAETSGTATEPEDEAAESTAEASQDTGEEASASAIEDVPEQGTEIAEEIAVAEAHTEVASDDVLDRVRKDAAPSAEDLAVPTYDELTLPSIRARLRKLTIAQVRDLRAYEVAHQGRPEFIKMYDNRISKLESEG